MKTIVLLATLSFFAPGLRAQDAVGAPLMLISDGRCGDYLEARQQGTQAGNPRQALLNSVASYTFGVLSAYNVYHGKPYIPPASVSANTIWAFMDKFCRENPLRETADGAFEMARELPKQN